MRFRRILPVFIIIIILLIAGLAGVISQKPSFLTDIRSSIPVLNNNFIKDEKYLFHDQLRKTYPMTLTEGEGTGLSVSGWLQTESILADRSLLVAIPAAGDTGSYWVKATIPDTTEYIGVLKLMNGTFAATQEWNVTPIKDIPQLLSVGQQVVLNFDTTEEETKQAINNFQNSKERKEVTLHSLNKIIVGVFQ
jgi:hypothetical protein